MVAGAQLENRGSRRLSATSRRNGEFDRGDASLGAI
jgi:hypothetical protein